MSPPTASRPECPLPPFPFRVAVVDDAPATPARIARILGPTVTVEHLTSPEALDRALDHRLDLLVVDHRIAWGDGLDVIRRARSLVASIAIIVFTDGGDERLAVATLRAGATDYLRKAVTDATLCERFCNVLSPWNSSAALDPAGVPALLEAANIGFIRSAPDGRLLDANPALARMAGLPGVAALAGLTTHQFYPAERDRERLIARMDEERVLRRQTTGMVRPDGTPVVPEIDARAVKHADGHTLYYEGHVRDVTGRERLRERVVFQASLLERARHAVSAFDNDHRITYWGREAERMFGYTPSDMLGRSIFDLLPPELHDSAREVIARVAASGVADFVAEDPVKSGGSLLTHKFFSSIIDGNGKRTGTIAVFVDVRDEHQRRQELQQALDDREALLREIHHRVKNNLQVVSSLLSLQARRTDTAALHAAVHESQVRLRAIGAIHEELYRAPALATVHAPAFLTALAGRLATMGGGMPAVILGEVEALAIGPDRATDLGLVLTELTLSWAHLAGLPAEGMVLRLDLAAASGGLVLTVAEDAGAGPARPGARFDLQGLALIAELARDMRCSLAHGNSPTPFVRVSFAGGDA